MLVELIERPVRRTSRHVWDLAADASEACGGTREAAAPVAAAVFCSMYSIHLVDDLLDEDPDGIYHRLGVGRAANGALALQALAGRVVEAEIDDPQTRALLQAELCRTAYDTARGQDLDSLDVDREEAYWDVVLLKTPPLFRCGLYGGALVGGASPSAAEELAGLGDEIGEIVQVNDDLHDALARPASADWTRDATNLAILYARVAEHPARERFEALRDRAEESAALVELQEILIECGSVSYCAYRLLEAHRRALERLDRLQMARPEVLAGVVDAYFSPLRRLFETVGVDAAEIMRQLQT
ncbi:MAG: polyprenyl synthetase family protein [Acidobacteriota bacterium]